MAVDAPKIPSIGDHAAIGDGRSVALVSKAGEVDWLCWPQVDSPAMFAALLDPERGGAWRIAPIALTRTSRRYLDDTNVLETRFESPAGAVTVTDLMTVTRRSPAPEHELLRIVRCERGALEIGVRFAPRPDFGRSPARLADTGALGIRCESGSHLVVLRGERRLTCEGDVASARFTLHAGERAAFSLTYDREAPATLPPLGPHVDDRLAETVAAWRAWARTMRYDGPYRGAVTRSALAIKLLTFAPSGAIVAAPTTSLPERVGGDLNWDYRFCWLRDAALTARAVYGIGFADEADAFCSWLLHTTRLTRPSLRVLYDVYGNVPDDEEELDLGGYRGSRPVRVRNAAAGQLQLDAYGEVIDAAIQAAGDRRLDRETQRFLGDLGRYVCAHWREPDQGIWEDREAPRHHTVSKVLCWVALDRLIRLAERGVVTRLPVDDLRRHRAAIREDVIRRGFDPLLSSYTQVYGGGEVDASLLLLGWYGFEDPSSVRMRGTLRMVEQRLWAGPGLYYRNEQGLRVGEGAFGICSFWVASLLARGAGSLDRARAVFEAMLGHANEVGLFAEEVDPRTGDALGNFPQAYTHVGLIDAALSIGERERRARRRAA